MEPREEKQKPAHWLRSGRSWDTAGRFCAWKSGSLSAKYCRVRPNVGKSPNERQPIHVIRRVAGHANAAITSLYINPPAPGDARKRVGVVITNGS